MGQMTPTNSAGGSDVINGDEEKTVTATLTWVPAAGMDNTSDPPPDKNHKVHLKESAGAWESSLWGGSGSATTGAGTADDGLGDPVDVNGTSQGTHLIQRDGSSGTITLDAVTVKAINPVSTYQSGYPGGGGGYGGYPGSGYHYWDWTGGEGSVSFTVAVVDDNRAVTISSPIEDSFYKGAYDSQHGTSRYQHQRNPYSGAMIVDSAVAWHDASSGLGGPGFAKGWQINNLPLTATPINFLGYPTYSWSLQGLSQGSLTIPTSNPTYFSLLEVDGSPFPLHGTVKVNATDSDGVVVSNTYGLTLHLPYEVTNTNPFDTECGKYNLGDARVGPVKDGETLLVQETKPTEIDWANTIDGATAIVAATGQEEIAGALEILGNLAKVTNFKTDVGPESSYNGATNGPTTWSDAQQENGEIYGGGNISPDDLKTDPNGWQLCDMYIYQEVHYTDKSWYADGYNLHGYDGNSQHVLYVRHIDYIHDEFKFIKYKNRDGSPYNP